MKNTSIEVQSNDLLEKLPRLYDSGITELYIHDRKLSKDRKNLLTLLDLVESRCPDLFLSLPIDIRQIDPPLIERLANLFISIEIPLEGSYKAGTLSFDKKVYKAKANLLNNEGLVFGFTMGWGVQEGDSFKSFRDRLDFATSLYPNHIDFPQFTNGGAEAKATGTYSSKDLDFSRSMAFACRTFYTAGRAVPWFNQIVAALKISPSSLFADADEWQQCNNCSYYTEFVPENAEHKEIERMQLSFLKEKFEEKHKGQLWTAAEDLIRLNGAFSRVVEEGEDSILELSYNPDDLLSPAVYELAKFCDTVTEEPCTVKIFEGQSGPDYKIK